MTLEGAVTRRFLENVPFDRLDYQPTPLSEPLGRLAVHVTEILGWWKSVCESNQLDFLNFEPRKISTKDEMLCYFDELFASAKSALSNVKDIEFEQNWSMTHGDEVLFVLSKKQVARLFCMNHLVHHRAQLGMYLRLLGVVVPATYGPSADDDHVILISPVF